jgi:hypothetical protein
MPDPTFAARHLLRSEPEQPARGTAADLRKNYWLGVVSGVAYNVYTVVLSTELVMTWFLSELTDSNLLISLLVPLDLGSWYFLQLLLAGYVRGRERALPLYRLMAIVRILALAALAALTATVDNSQVLLPAFLALFAVNSIAAGVAALPFLNVVAKTIPPTRRGAYFGWRRFAGGLLGLLGGLGVKAILAPDSRLGFPDNYAVLFLWGCVITGVLVGSFSLVSEPAEAVDPQPPGVREQLWRAVRLPVRDRNYRKYLALRVATAMANYAVPFYAVYARRALSAPENAVGTYLVVRTGTSVVSNLVLGRVADRFGSRRVARLAALTVALAPLTALVVAAFPGNAAQKGALLAVVFAVQGLHVGAQVIGSTNYVLELAPSIERVTYISVANGVAGLAVLSSPLGGAIADQLGFVPLFVLALVCGAVAVWMAWGLQEPREAVAPPS